MNGTGIILPMTAARYGVIPITTLADGLADNMDSEIAVLVGEDGLAGAISHAAALYADTQSLAAKRLSCMARDFSWKTRKAGYIDLYNVEE